VGVECEGAVDGTAETGDADGTAETGEADGAVEAGDADGEMGDAVGTLDGLLLGRAAVGANEGDSVGYVVGATVGDGESALAVQATSSAASTSSLIACAPPLGRYIVACVAVHWPMSVRDPGFFTATKERVCFAKQS